MLLRPNNGGGGVKWRINPRPTKGGCYHPPYSLSPAAQKCKRKWPRASRTSLLHPLRSFWWKKKPGCPPKMGVGWVVKVRRQGGWLPPQNILSRHFEKHLHGMVLKLSGHVRNTIFLLYMQKPGEIPIFGTFLAKKLIFCQFWSMFTENPLSESGHVWKRHCDVTRWPNFISLVSMERGDPTLYHGTKQSYFGPVNFKFIRGGGNHPPPLVKHVTKKGLVGRGLK